MDIALKWLPPITLEDKILIMDTLTGTDNTLGTPLLKKYVELILPYKDVLGLTNIYVGEREVDCLASGMIFFYGCLFYIMHFPKWGSYINAIFYYNLLYILVDHYIDDVKVEFRKKSKAIEQMYILINNPNACLDFVDPILKIIAGIYNKLLLQCPNIKGSIKRLFDSQIKGVKIQKDSDYTREVYYDIAMDKGGHTMQVIQDMLGGDEKILESSYHIGTIMQLIDDIADVCSDQEKGINTIATHEITTKGYLDDLWYDIMNRIDLIDDRFIVYKILYTVFAIYLPDRHRTLFREKLWSETTKVNAFDYTYGCNGSLLLVNAVMNELMAIQAIQAMKNNI